MLGRQREDGEGGEATMLGRQREGGEGGEAIMLGRQRERITSAAGAYAAGVPHVVLRRCAGRGICPQQCEGWEEVRGSTPKLNGGVCWDAGGTYSPGCGRGHSPGRMGPWYRRASGTASSGLPRAPATPRERVTPSLQKLRIRIYNTAGKRLGFAVSHFARSGKNCPEFVVRFSR